MKVDLYLAEMQMDQNVEEALARAEQARLAQLVKSPKESRRWRLPLSSALQNLWDSLRQQRLLHHHRSST